MVRASVGSICALVAVTACARAQLEPSEPRSEAPTRVTAGDPGAGEGPRDGDSDGDGVLDADDLCPEAGETRNGYEDEDGCPDDRPVSGQIRVIRGIFYPRGSAAITAQSEPVLDEVVTILKDHPSLRVAVTGHTDSHECRGATCVDLGRARAQRVQEYLRDLGIDPLRVEVRSAGADEPIEPNGTAAGRDKNRRIDFTVLSQ